MEYREIYSDLLEWKKTGRGKPLILLGARGVGKTTLIKEFGKKEFRQIIYINLEEMTEINELFANPLSLEELLNKTAGLLGFFEVNINDTLFVIEEIQSCPTIMSLIHFVYEKIPPFYLIISSSNPGTLLNMDISHFMNKIKIVELKPNSFEEFLQFANPNLFKEYLNINLENHLDKILHNQLLFELQNYLIVGGMPDCLSVWKSTKNLNKINFAQETLINNFKNEFIISNSKVSAKKINEVFLSIPNQLNNSSNKFMFTKINKQARSREYENSLNWLLSSKIIDQIFQIKDNIATGINQNFKIYLKDVGLFKHLLNISNDLILLNKDFQSKHSLMETFVLQQLTLQFRSEQIQYFSFNTKFHLDFILKYKDLVIPIEIKSSQIKDKTALKNYLKNYDCQIAIKYTFGYLKVEKNILYIPFYLIDKTKKFIDYYLKTKSN